MKRYFNHLRRQPHYVQRIHAGFFASVMTALVVGLWLYYEYGFWNDKYVIESGNIKEEVIENKITESPLDVLKNIYNESLIKAKTLNFFSKGLLESSTTINMDADVRP